MRADPIDSSSENAQTYARVHNALEGTIKSLNEQINGATTTNRRLPAGGPADSRRNSAFSPDQDPFTHSGADWIVPHERNSSRARFCASRAGPTILNRRFLVLSDKACENRNSPFVEFVFAFVLNFDISKKHLERSTSYFWERFFSGVSKIYIKLYACVFTIWLMECLRFGNIPYGYAR